jgi:SAM-dependent methyltransferase
MRTQILNRFKKEINYYGISYFINLKVTEIFYGFKTGNLELHCLDGYNKVEATNSLSVNGDSMKNESTAFYQIKKGLFVTGLAYSSISLLDIGCGYGKQLFFGMLNGFKKVAGIDLDESVVARAKSNCRRMYTKGNNTVFNVKHADACEFTLPQGVNVRFMANPFGRKTMEIVMEKIIRYRNNVSGPLYIVYSVPVHQEVLERYAMCKKIYEKRSAGKVISLLTVFEIIQCSHQPFVNSRQLVTQCV